jgi:hypothetical protein
MPTDGLGGRFINALNPLEVEFVDFSFVLFVVVNFTSLVLMTGAVVVVVVVGVVVEATGVGEANVVVVVVAGVNGDEALSPSSNRNKVSRGTLHPQPFKSEYCVRRQWMSRPNSWGKNGRRKFSGVLKYAIFLTFFVFGLNIKKK